MDADLNCSIQTQKIFFFLWPFWQVYGPTKKNFYRKMDLFTENGHLSKSIKPRNI